MGSGSFRQLRQSGMATPWACPENALESHSALRPARSTSAVPRPVCWKCLFTLGPSEEHHATRNSGFIFDVSHMGRLSITGPAAEGLLERVVTRKIAA